MAAKYFAILTNLGAAKLANATALGTQLEITHMAVGDGGGGLPIPNPAQTELIGERRRAAINLLTIDPLNNSQIISEQVIPEDVGGWWIREVGLFDKDGALVAIANCPETYKPQLQEGSGRTQTIRVILIVSSTQSVSLKIDPSVVLSTRKYVDDNVIEVRAYAEKLMAEHIAHEDAHPQYTKKDQNGADIPDKAQFRANVGLKSAALRDVGTGPSQVPDMSAWASGSKWRRGPDGVIEQWGQVTISNFTPAQGSTALNVPQIQGVYSIQFPIPFTSEIIDFSITPVRCQTAGMWPAVGAYGWPSFTGVIGAPVILTGSPGEYIALAWRAKGK